jgi:hypothetical protein
MDTCTTGRAYPLLQIDCQRRPSVCLCIQRHVIACNSYDAAIDSSARPPPVTWLPVCACHLAPPIVTLPPHTHAFLARHNGDDRYEARATAFELMSILRRGAPYAPQSLASFASRLLNIFGRWFRCYLGFLPVCAASVLLGTSAAAARPPPAEP